MGGIGRKHLPHDVPFWVDPSIETYYLTVCCQPRNQNHLALPEVAEAIFETVEFRQKNHVWFVYVIIAMPDHVHLLVSFPRDGDTIKSVITRWKAWTAKRIGIRWQRDFFEHRLRGDESRREKADYILQNPVRAGLVERAEDWPFTWLPKPG